LKKRLTIFALSLVTVLVMTGTITANGGGSVFIADETGGTVTVLDGVNHLTVERTMVGEGPHSLAFSPDFQRVYVVNREGAAVVILDRQTYTVVARIPTEGRPEQILMDPDGKSAYVTNSVSIFDRITLDLMSVIPVAVTPFDVVFMDDSNTLFVSATLGGGVSVVDVEDRRITEVLTACSAPRDMAVTLDYAFLYVTCEDSDQVAICNTSDRSQVKFIGVASQPWGVAISEDNRWALVTSRGADVVTVINNATQTIKSVVPAGKGPTVIVAASQPMAPIQFRPGAPIVIELPRTGAGAVPDGTPWPLFLGLIGLTTLAVGSAAIAWRKKVFGRR